MSTIHPSIKIRNDMRSFVIRSLLDEIDNNQSIVIKSGMDSELRSHLFRLVNDCISFRGSHGSLVLSFKPELRDLNIYFRKGIRLFKSKVRDALRESLSVLPESDSYLN